MGTLAEEKAIKPLPLGSVVEVLSEKCEVRSVGRIDAIFKASYTVTPLGRKPGRGWGDEILKSRVRLQRAEPDPVQSPRRTIGDIWAAGNF